jgi:hypothetical protein
MKRRGKGVDAREEKPGDTQAPFRRFTEFARRIVAVPHSEVKRKAQEFRKKQKPRRNPLIAFWVAVAFRLQSPLSGQVRYR